MIGPAFIGYTDTKLFKQLASNEAQQLVNADRKAVEILRNSCPVEEWDDGGSEFRPDKMVEVLVDQQLAAVASYDFWGEHIAHISIISRPTFRGRGYGVTAVSELTRVALERHLVPQYRTLEENRPSMAIARRLGFVQYATSMAIRFLADSSAPQA